MAYSEDDETIIICNEGDRREGFFRWSTTKANDFEKLKRRVGGEQELINVVVTTDGKQVTSWMCKVPIRFLSRAHWGVGKKKAGNAKNFSTQKNSPTVNS